MDYLDEWRAEMLLLKWKTAMGANPAFAAIDQTCATIRRFYPPSDLEKNDTINPDNWVLHVLANKQFNSVVILREHAILLDFYYANSNYQISGLKSGYGVVNHRQLNETLFELYLIYVLHNAGLTISSKETFLENGNIKPIDIALYSGFEMINVEVTKFYDPVKEELMQLALNAARTIVRVGNKTKIRPEELFSVNVVLKKRQLKIAKTLKVLLEQLLKNHIDNFRKPEMSTIRSVTPVENESVSISVDSIHASLKRKDDEHRFATFNVTLRQNLRTNLVTANFSIEFQNDTETLNKYLVEKIKEKVDQQRYFQGKKVIVIGIDNVYTTHGKASTPPIFPEQVDVTKVQKVVNKDTLLWLIFKTIPPGSAQIKVNSMTILGSRDHPAGPLLAKINVDDLMIWK